MNGPEHYAEAERLLEFVMDTTTVSPLSDPVNLAAAQVHATLAHAAATLWRTVPGDVNAGWADALGHVSKPPPPDPWATP